MKYNRQQIRTGVKYYSDVYTAYVLRCKDNKLEVQGEKTWENAHQLIHRKSEENKSKKTDTRHVIIAYVYYEYYTSTCYNTHVCVCLFHFSSNGTIVIIPFDTSFKNCILV